MQDQYDVIVIGAGNGGLCAAAASAKAGKRTLLLERHNVPGGSATSFRRGRFEFEASLHELAGVGTKEAPGEVLRLFEELEVPPIDWVQDKNAFRVVAPPPGYDVTLPADRESFIEGIERQVPGSKASVEAVFDLGRKAMAALAYLGQGKPDFNVLLNEHADFLRIASHSMREVLDVLGMPEEAQKILMTYWPYLGAPADQIDFLQYVMMLMSYLNDKPSMPRMRSHELSLALEQALLKHGGEVWYNTDVAKILVDDGRAVGVELPDGSRLYAREVICNAHVSKALASMIAEEDVPKEMLQLANARRLGLTFFTLYLGLDRSAEDLGIRDYSVFLLPDTDSRVQYEMADVIPDGGFVVVNCLNVPIPDASPEGTCMLFFTTFYIGDPFKDVRPEDHRKLKLDIAEDLIARYQKALGIEIRSHIEQIETASPSSFTRYLNSPMGTSYGYELQPWDSVLLRTMNIADMEKIKGLHFCGACAERGDGYSSTYVSGAAAAKRALQDMAETEGK